MFVKKKDGKLRLCADYRALNEVTKKGSTTTATHYRGPRQTRRSQILHEARYQGRLPQHSNQRRRRMEDNLFNKTGNLRISSHAIWTMQRTGSVPKMNQGVFYGIY